VYIVHKMDRYLTFFHTTQLKLWSLHTLKYFITHIHIKLGCKLTFSLLLTFGELHFHLLCKKVVFYFFIPKLHTLKTTQKLVTLNTANTLFICIRQHISCNLGLSEFLEYICYFLSFIWISTCLSKVFPSWPMCTSNMIGKILQKSYLVFYFPF
jgi:hypothetical protein